MPSNPLPLVDPRFGRFTPIVQAAQSHDAALAAIVSGMGQQAVKDQYGNTIELSGTNLNQIVIIGAAYKQPGVWVGTVSPGTGILNGTAGRAARTGLVIVSGGITLNGTTAATVGSGTGLAVNMMIGAVDANGNQAITPGTYIQSISGTSVTLSQAAAKSGAALYCAACNWSLVT